MLKRVIILDCQKFNKYKCVANSLSKFTSESKKTNDENSIANRKPDENVVKQDKKPIMTKLLFPEIKSHEEKKEDEGSKRKGPFKNYFEDEERDKNKIAHYEEFFDTAARGKTAQHFIVPFFKLILSILVNEVLILRLNFKDAVEAFKITNPSKNLYIDFIYGALLKMKEFNAHTNLGAYRKLMEVFPIGIYIIFSFQAFVKT
jgi:hypothetical protein